MDRYELERYLMESHNCTSDCPWADYPEHRVFRHVNNKKWFALIMRIPREKLGLCGGNIDIVNLKCDPLLIGSLRLESGVFRAYHMNHDNWVSVALDGTAPDELIKALADMSFNLTEVKPRRCKYSN